jgi:hypothetical protein
MCCVCVCWQITNAPRGGGGKEVSELHEAVRALVKSMNSRWVGGGGVCRRGLAPDENGQAGCLTMTVHSDCCGQMQ